jgi:RNA recognition motif-containing protein
MNKLYVGNLSYSTDEAALKAAFAEYGNIVSVAVITDRATGRSKGFGFVEFETEAEAKAAMDAMNNAELDGRALKVDMARPKSE